MGFGKRFEVPFSYLTLVNSLLCATVTAHKHMCFYFYESKMARTKNGVHGEPAGPPAMSPRALLHKSTRSRYLGRIVFARAREREMEIRNWCFRFPEHLFTRRFPFDCLVCDILQDYMAAPHFLAQAVEALHCAAERIW